jgi:hypothetical protein
MPSYTGPGAAPVYQKSGHCTVYHTDRKAAHEVSDPLAQIPPAVLLQWELEPEIAHAAKLAVEDSRKMASDLQLEVSFCAIPHRSLPTTSSFTANLRWSATTHMAKVS